MELEKKVFQPCIRILIADLLIALFISFFILVYFSIINFFIALFLSLLVLIGLPLLKYLAIKNTFIELQEDGVQIRKGIILKNRSMFLYSQIQDVKESQGLIKMALDLKDLRIKTMTISSAFKGFISGLSVSDANFIRKHIFEKIREESIKTMKKKSPQLIEKGLLEEESQEKLIKNPYKIHFFKIFLYLSVTYFILFIIASLFLILFSLFEFLFILINFSFMGLGFFLFGIIILAISYRYFIGKTRLEIVQGIISFHRNNVPYFKVQDIVLFRPIAHRIAGLCDITIATGERQIEYSTQRRNQSHIRGNVIPFLDFGDAQKIKEKIFTFLGINLEEGFPELSKTIPLENAKVIKKTFASMVLFSVILICFFSFILIFFLKDLSFITEGFVFFIIAGIFFLIIFIVVKLVHEFYYLKKYYYNVSKDVIIIRKGVFNVKEITIPFNNIQNIFVDQDIFDRVFRLYDVHISTVTPHSVIHSHIDGLNKQNAEKIREILSDKIINVLKKPQ